MYGTHPGNVTPMWTDHLHTVKSKEVSPELDKEITKELKDAPKPIMVEPKTS